MTTMLGIPVGLLAAQVAAAEGGLVVLLGTGRDRQRLELARELGVAHTVDVEAEDPVERLGALTRGYGADVVVECAGVPRAIDLAFEVVRKRGRMTQMGLPGRPVEIDFEKVAFKELQVSGGIGQRRPAWRRSLALMERGLVQLEPLISHRLPLAEWERAFDMVEKQEGTKVLLMP